MSGKSVEKLMEKSVESVEKNSWKSVVSHQSSEILLKNVGAKYTYDVVFGISTMVFFRGGGPEKTTSFGNFSQMGGRGNLVETQK